ncbi:MFS transporter, partial [Megamonas funiformis]
PFMGWLVDNTKTKWGKFRPWILIGTIINSFVLILLYLNPATFLQGILINAWCIVTYLLWSLTYTLMDVPFWANCSIFMDWNEYLFFQICSLS